MVGFEKSRWRANDCLLLGGLCEDNWALTGLWCRERGGLEDDKTCAPTWGCEGSRPGDGVAELGPDLPEGDVYSRTVEDGGRGADNDLSTEGRRAVAEL